MESRGSLCVEFVQKRMKLYRTGLYCRHEVGQVGLAFIDFPDANSAVIDGHDGTARLLFPLLTKARPVDTENF